MAKNKKLTAAFSILAVLCVASLTSPRAAAAYPSAVQDSHRLTASNSPAIELIYVSQYQLKWWDTGSGGNYDGAFYNPVVPAGYYMLGSYAQGNYGTPFGPVFAARELLPGALAAPTDYAWIWDDSGSGADLDGSMWRPIPPAGYVCLGDIAQAGYAKPSLDLMRCVRSDLAASAAAGPQIWIDAGTGADDDFGSWRLLPSLDEAVFLNTFIGNSTWSPPGIPLYSLRSEAVRMPERFSQAEVQALIEQYGPLIYFHPEEQYLMDSVEWFLDHGVSMSWALVENDTDFDTISFSNPGAIPTSSLTFEDDLLHVRNEVKPDPPYNNSDSFKSWLTVPGSILAGDLTRAEALVRVVPWDTLFTEIQFWFFYPYNGPGRVEVCASGSLCENHQLTTNGRHYGDWEHVSLVFDTELASMEYVYMSAHGGGHWYPKAAFGSALTFHDITHPIVYAGKYSHAHYASPGYHDYMRVFSFDYGLGTFSVDLFDLTGAGTQFETYQPGNYRVISSGFIPQAEPDWTRFTGRWGQYEKLSTTFDTVFYDYTYKEVGAGPTGPNQKTAWEVGDSGDLFGWPEEPVDLFSHLYLPVTRR